MSHSKSPQKNYHYGFFLLVELEIKPTTFYHHTLKYHNTRWKNQVKKSLSKFLRF
jgi:hypothetical protein